jgi:hypothetical protein
MLTTTELIDEVRTHLAGRDDVTDARIVRAINLGQEYIARTRDYEELRKIESGVLVITADPKVDKFIAFSSLTNSNPLEIYSFRVITNDGRSRKLVYRTSRSFDRLIPEPEFHARGTPNSYTVWADKFELWRVPDIAHDFELRLTIFPTALSIGTPDGVSDFREKDDLLIFLAVSWVFGSLGEYERAGRFFSFYRVRAKEAEMKESRRPDQDIISDGGKARPDAIIGTPWSDPFVRYIR